MVTSGFLAGLFVPVRLFPDWLRIVPGRYRAHFRIDLISALLVGTGLGDR